VKRTRERKTGNEREVEGKYRDRGKHKRQRQREIYVRNSGLM
jgi:hypothetical protein